MLGPGLYDVVVANMILIGGGGAWEVRFTAIEIPTAQCIGDADGNGEVNFADITEVLGNWLADYTPGTEFEDPEAAIDHAA